LADLDEQMVTAWDIMADTPPTYWVNKRLSFDYLDEAKNLTREEILADLAGVSSREKLADRIASICAGCAEAIRRAGTLNSTVRKGLMQKIQLGQRAANGKTWEEIYFNFLDDATRSKYINRETLKFDWDRFFSMEKYQAHHYYPVNLFADNDGAFRAMFENISDAQKQAVVDYFNSYANGIMLPNKRVVNGTEFVIHTNHAAYEGAIADFLNKRREAYKANKFNDQQIAQRLFADIQKVNFESLIVEESLLKNTNVDDLDLSNILK
jgi:hypothetical protein